MCTRTASALSRPAVVRSLLPLAHSPFVCPALTRPRLLVRTDNTIKIWDCGDYSLITALSGHTIPIRELTFQNDKLYSKDDYGEIKIWKL